MLETIVASVYFIWTIVYCGLYVSYKIGQFLVTITNVLLENVFMFISGMLEVVIVLIEAFTIFFQDIVQCFQELCRIMSCLMDIILLSVSTTLCDINIVIDNLILAVVATYNFVVSCCLNVVTIIGQTFIFFKRLIVLFGSGVWFLVTFIPLLIIYFGTLCTYYVGKLLEELRNSVLLSILTAKSILKQLYEFITDVPAESIAGIIIAVCLVYIVVQFYVIVYLYMYEQFRKIFRYCRQRYNRFRIHQAQTVPRTFRISLKSRPQVRRNIYPPTSSKRDNELDERCCIICQERVKCILVLPCRHVCMCNECSIRLQLYNNTCPVCRNDIESTMKIFV